MEQSTLVWGLIIMIAMPILAVILIECVRYFEKQNSLFTPVVRNIWQYIFPLTVLLLVMTKLLNFNSKSILIKSIETGFWIAAFITLLEIINSLLTTKEVEKGHLRRIKVSNLSFQLTRSLVLAIIFYYVFEVIWQVNLANLAGALGIGSLVIALALQDTFSGLFSGFLLAIDRPFKVGDWIKFDDVEGEVIDQNWRAVRVETMFGDEIIIPNSVLSKAVITNPVNLYPWIWRELYVRFAYHHPPNLVKKVILEEVFQKTPNIFVEPKPVVRISAYEDFYIKYYIGFAMSDGEYRSYLDYDDLVMTQIYYATKRANLITPISTKVQLKTDQHPYNPYYNPNDKYDRDYIQQFLGVLSYFSYLDEKTIRNLATQASLKTYGMNEYVIQAQEPDQGLYIILEGSVKLQIKDWQNEEKIVSHLFKGDLFGEMALLENEFSPVSILAIEDVTVVIFDHKLINTIIDSNPKFGRDMNQFIEERKKLIGFTKGSDNVNQNQTNQDDFTKLFINN